MTTACMLSQAAMKELQIAASRIRPPVAAHRLWERYLTPADRARLGGNLQEAYYQHGTAGIWCELRGVTPLRAIIEVTKLMGFLRDEDYQWLLRETGELVDVDEVMSRAISAGDLVVIEHPREAFWNGEQIEIDWNRHTALWVFLWELARSSKSGRPIDAFTFGERTDQNVVTRRKSRLAKMKGFPLDLIDSIEPVGRGSQQIMLPRERIRVFEATGVDSLAEWTP